MQNSAEQGVRCYTMNANILVSNLFVSVQEPSRVRSLLQCSPAALKSTSILH